MYKDNLIIQSFWFGTRLGPMEIMCIRSYLYHGHQFHLYVFNEVENIPPGTVVKDAADILSEGDIYKDSFGGYVNLSNLFRYTLLLKKGGWWVDMDTVCLKPFNFSQKYVFSSESSDPYNRYMVNTTFIKSEAGAGFLHDCLAFLEQRGTAHIHWGELGVNLISRMIFRNQLQEYICPSHYFCPVSAYQVRSFVEAGSPALPGSYAIHWWNEIWRKLEIDKDGKFDDSSLYEILKRKFQ